jgi:hypothetical protein
MGSRLTRFWRRLCEPATFPDRQRTAVFAHYSLVGALVGAFGALAAGLPEILARATSVDVKTAHQAMFLLYAMLGVASALIYRKLPVTIAVDAEAPTAPLQHSKRIVYTLAALFSIDAFGGGFMVCKQDHYEGKAATNPRSHRSAAGESAASTSSNASRAGRKFSTPSRSASMTNYAATLRPQIRRTTGTRSNVDWSATHSTLHAAVCVLTSAFSG